MPSVAPSSSTELFLRWRAGEMDAEAELTPTIYAELGGLARRYLRREHVHTLQPTELVNEAFVRLIGSSGEAKDRSHFMALAARTMRRVLVDHARRRRAGKRFSQEDRVTLETDLVQSDTPPVDVMVLDQALEQLSLASPRAARLVELRFFGGLTCPEAAEVLQTSLSSAEREWRAARAWLRKALTN